MGAAALLGAAGLLGTATAASPLGAAGPLGTATAASAPARGHVRVLAPIPRPGYPALPHIVGNGDASLAHLLASDDELVVEVAYCDLADRQEAATTIYLAKDPVTREYYVARIRPGRPRRFTMNGEPRALQDRSSHARATRSHVAQPPNDVSFSVEA